MSDLENKLKLKFDIAVFFASAYIMDDFLFIKTFRRLKDSGVREIMDFHAGYIDLRSFITYLSTPLTKNNFVRKLFGKPLVGKNDCAGKFIFCQKFADFLLNQINQFRIIHSEPAAESDRWHKKPSDL